MRCCRPETSWKTLKTSPCFTATFRWSLPETLRRMASIHGEKEAFITLITSESTAPHGLGRIVRDESGGVAAIVEDSEADDGVRAIKEVNVGVYSHSLLLALVQPGEHCPFPPGRDIHYRPGVVGQPSREDRRICTYGPS